MHQILKQKNIILSIKPVFVDKILSGEKKYEFRRRLGKVQINNIYIYATSPVKKIVGEAEVIDKLIMDKEKLWEKTHTCAGITKEFYDKYFEGIEYACAYELGKVKKFNEGITLNSIGINTAPQSYIYVDENLET